MLHLRSIKLYTPMEHLITSQKLTLMLLRSSFCKKFLKRNINHRYFNLLFLNFQPQNVLNLFLSFNQFHLSYFIKFGLI